MEGDAHAPRRRLTFASVLEWLIKGFVLVMILLGGFAYLTFYERKALARIQVRDRPQPRRPVGTAPAHRGCRSN